MTRDIIGISEFCRNCKCSPKHKTLNCTISCAYKEYKKGDYILRKDSRVSQLSLVVSGSVETVYTLDSGATIPVISPSNNIEQSIILGSMAIFSDNTRMPFDVIANDDCEVIFITREKVEHFMMNCKEFLYDFVNFNTNRAQSATKHLSILTLRTLKAKLAYYLISISDNNEYRLPMSMVNLAEYLCVDRSSLSRAFKQFEIDGAITHKRNRGRILNINYLRQLI